MREAGDGSFWDTPEIDWSTTHVKRTWMYTQVQDKMPTRNKHNSINMYSSES